MKKLVTLLVGLVLSVALVSAAHAVPLVVGGSESPTGAVSPGGTSLASITSSFAGIFGRIAGTVTQNVLSNSNGILFEYIINSTGAGSITQATASFFDVFTTDVDGPVFPYLPGVDNIHRGLNGETVTWSYLDDAIRTGNSSGTLWVQTNAPWYAEGGFSVIGADTATLRMYGPSSVVPEPASMILLGIGLSGLAVSKRKKKLV